jgi:hypothetical protein
MPECRTEAYKGISSRQFIAENTPGNQADRVVISLGANDDAVARTLDNLIELRKSVHARVVYWLVPASSQRARAAVRAVALRYGDRIIDTAPFAGEDGLHPTGTGYRKLAMMTR